MKIFYFFDGNKILRLNIIAKINNDLHENMPKPLLIKELTIDTKNSFKELKKSLNYWFLLQTKMTYIIVYLLKLLSRV